MKKYSREWFKARGEAEAYEAFREWLSEQMSIEVAYEDHYSKWRVHCGPTLAMLEV